MLRVIVASSILALFSVANGQPLFEPPEGLSATDAPDVSGTPLKKVEKFSDEDGFVQVTILVHPPITHKESAGEFANGIISGMENKGLSDGQITDAEVRGYQCKRIEGVFSSDSYEGEFKATTLALFSSDAIYNLALTVHDSAQIDLSVEELAERLNISGEPIVLETGPAPPSSAFQAGEKFGEILAYVVFVVAIVLVVKRLNRKKVEQDEDPKPDNAPS